MANYKDTTATRKIFQQKKRIRAVCGGTSASKTISILFWCIDRAQSYPAKHKGTTELISIVSETYPHLEKGAMLDFENIMKDAGYWEDSRWHGTKHQYTFESGSKIEFFSVDTYGKAHGPRRDILFVNEVNNMEYKIVDQLIIRTKKIIWMDWNPTVEFWFYTEMLGQRDDIDFITLTYKDNEALDEITVAEIESHKNNLNWWKVYGLGQLGEVAGKIYRDWKFIDEIPHEARLERRGLDFGFSNDPAALVDVYYYNGGYILDERFYQLELHNKPIADFIMNCEYPQCLVIADSAEPKSINELQINGVNVIGADKGPGSKNKGISYMQDQRISVTKRSINGIREYRRYLWKTDKDGIQLREAEKGNDHFLDAARYAMESLRPPDDEEEMTLSGNITKMWG
jgi:phage terminase large subunit